MSDKILCPKCGEQEREIEALLDWQHEAIKTLMQAGGMTCELVKALEASVKLQSHYAGLLNQYDGGNRMQFDSPFAWLKRLEEVEHERHRSRKS
jgi:hypothetical protein